MPRSQAPKLSGYSAVAVTVGLVAATVAFASHKFALLFVTATSLWILVLLLLYRDWWQRLPRIPGRKKIYKGVAVVTGFLIFTIAWYFITYFDPSLK